MILDSSTIDYFLSQIIRDYLKLSHTGWMALKGLTPTVDTAALDIPAGFPIVAVDFGGVPVRPGITVAPRETDGSTSARRQIQISCLLCTWLKSSAEGAAEVTQQTTRGEASAIQIAMDNRLRDLDAFSAWLATLDSETLAGWNIIAPLVVSNAPPARNATMHTVDYATLIRTVVAVQRHSFG